MMKRWGNIVRNRAKCWVTYDLAAIGGVLVEFEGKVYDGSVRTQLEKMKQRIARGY